MNPGPVQATKKSNEGMVDSARSAQIVMQASWD